MLAAVMTETWSLVIADAIGIAIACAIVLPILIVVYRRMYR